jgi:hypothetical protein
MFINLRCKCHLQTASHTEMKASPGKYAVLCEGIKSTALWKSAEGIYFSLRADELRDADEPISSDVQTMFNNSTMELRLISDGFFRLSCVIRRSAFYIQFWNESVLRVTSSPAHHSQQ